MTDLKKRMSQHHEGQIASVLGGRRARSSGNQFNDQMDGRHDRHVEPFAMAWDCKATRGKSVSITREMWEKAVEQAHAERPCIPLRLYTTDNLHYDVDLIALAVEDFVEMRDAAIEVQALRALVHEYQARYEDA